MPKEQAIDRGPTKRQSRKGKPRQPEFAHEIEPLVGKSSGQEQRKINGDRIFASIARAVSESASLSRFLGTRRRRRR